MTDSETKFEQWAIVELFGHTRIAGRLTEQTIGGCSFVRVDVPEVRTESETLPGFTKLYGQGAIYGVTFVDQATAEISARNLRVQPVDVWSLRRGLEGMSAHDRQSLLPTGDKFADNDF